MKTSTRPARGRLAAAVLAGAVLIAACGGGDDSDSVADAEPVADTTGSDDTAAPDTTATAGDAAGATGDAPELLRFTAPLVGGGEIDAATTAGTPTAFWFWSPT